MSHNEAENYVAAGFIPAWIAVPIFAKHLCDSWEDNAWKIVLPAKEFVS